jgi:hypothetical protein
MVTLIQWSSFQKSVSKFTPKKFYEIDPWTCQFLTTSKVFDGRRDVQHNDTQHNDIQQMGLFATLGMLTFCINDTQHNNTRAHMLSVIMLNVLAVGKEGYYVV